MADDTPPPPSQTGAGPAPPLAIVHGHFDVSVAPAAGQLLAWRERLGMIIDVLPSRATIALPFHGVMDRYEVGDLLFTDSETDQVTQERTIARISRDNLRRIAFHMVLSGANGCVVGRPANRAGSAQEVGILAIDLDQPIFAQRDACRHATLFVPGTRLQHLFPDPGALHGRVLGPHQPTVRLILARAQRLADGIRHLPAEAACRELLALVELIAAAYAEAAGLRGGKRAIARAMAFDHARRFVHAHLTDSELTPESVLQALGLSRPSLYRLFQHEGGLGAYIRHLRLRAAADDLVRYPGLTVQEVAYAVGFQSASDFTRAFRRAYGMAPLEMRHYGGARDGEQAE
ncbi:helix-turn-helix transcriptional regulator [Cupriavidus sp. USMAHM13]|uniref:helix-turn-helix transcriptional regulator n=1 Tax=Cupriavidus sp. USMAHM13 TaxID=1389192 RepID=UPI0009F20F1E|nr:AraC family transcriptional regulator [Cupriavidus sp. USMAHM13]